MWCGSPSTAGNCASDYRSVIETTVGFWHKFYKGDRGAMQWGLQYSYLQLAAWSGTNGTPIIGSPQYNPHANDSMFFTSYRYYLP